MFILYVILYRCLKLVYLHVCVLSYLWFYCIMYQIKWNCVTGQHGRTVVLLNAITLYKYIWNKKKPKKQRFHKFVDAMSKNKQMRLLSMHLKCKMTIHSSNWRCFTIQPRKRTFAKDSVDYKRYPPPLNKSKNTFSVWNIISNCSEEWRKACIKPHWIELLFMSSKKNIEIHSHIKQMNQQDWNRFRPVSQRKNDVFASLIAPILL